MSRNYIDYKITIWRRMHLKDKANMINLVKKLEGKAIGTADDLMAETDDWDDIFDDEDELLYETEVSMTPEENEGSSTVEVYKEDEVIWSNQKQTS